MARTWTVLDDLRALAPEIESRAGEIATLRRLPPDLVAKLKTLGACSRWRKPRTWNGTSELDEGVRRPEPLYCYAGMFLASWHGVALGLTRRAIDAGLPIVQSKVSLFPPPSIPLWDEAQHTRRVSPLDRLLRDAITMSQHLLLGDAYFEMIGAAILGEPPAHTGVL
jgi:hypothetical protein